MAALVFNATQFAPSETEQYTAVAQQGSEPDPLEGLSADHRTYAGYYSDYLGCKLENAEQVLRHIAALTADRTAKNAQEANNPEAKVKQRTQQKEARAEHQAELRVLNDAWRKAIRDREAQAAHWVEQERLFKEQKANNMADWDRWVAVKHTEFTALRTGKPIA